MLLDTMCHIAENVGGRKNCWIDGQLPKFFPSDLQNIQYLYLFGGHSPKFSLPNNLNSWILPMFSPTCASHYTVHCLVV